MVELRNIWARYGRFELKDIGFRAPAGSYTVLLGPPGSGKTSIIELICGLRKRLHGSVLLGERHVAQLDPAERQIAYVPQDYALFPSMTVFENIAFGLKVRRLRKKIICERVKDEADRLGIGHLLDRRTAGLSGGERQRVALARALVLHMRILLLDEPVSALDEATRERVCLELRQLHDRLGMTTVHISHNFEETRMVADLVGVMNEGRLMQFGTTEDVFRRPANEFVARFVRAGNIIKARYQPQADGQTTMIVGNQRAVLGCRAEAGDRSLLLRGAEARVLLPSDVANMAQPPLLAGQCRLAGVVMAIYENGGLAANLKIALDGHEPVSVAVSAEQLSQALRPGLPVTIAFSPERLHVLGTKVDDQI